MAWLVNLCEIVDSWEREFMTIIETRRLRVTAFAIVPCFYHQYAIWQKCENNTGCVSTRQQTVPSPRYRDYRELSGRPWAAMHWWQPCQCCTTCWCVKRLNSLCRNVKYKVFICNKRHLYCWWNVLMGFQTRTPENCRTNIIPKPKCNNLSY